MGKLADFSAPSTYYIIIIIIIIIIIKYAARLAVSMSDY